MKKKIIKSLLGLLSAVVILNSSYAQTTAMLPPNTSDQKTKHAYNLNNPEPVSKDKALSANEVSSKAIRTFERNFKHTTNQQWYGLKGNTYLTTFIDKEGRDSRVLFAKNGYMIYAISYGEEQILPIAYRRQIKSRYVDYSIGRVIEINVDDQKVWVINLEDANTIVIARLTEEGILDELEHYQKRLLTKKHRRQ
jgi:hypothetical protein